MNKRAIVNVAVGGWYPQGQKRLERSILDFGGSVEFVRWTDSYPKGSPSHQQTPYAFKPFALGEAAQTGFERLLWMDAALFAIRSMNPLWDQLDRDGFLLWFDRGWTVGQWCSDAALDPLRITREESFAIPMVHACLVGLDLRRTENRDLLSEWHALAQDGRAFVGPWENRDNTASNHPRVLGHRHDQTALSVLVHRYGLQPLSRPDMFAYWDTKVDSRTNGKLDSRTIVLSSHGHVRPDELEDAIANIPLKETGSGCARECREDFIQALDAGMGTIRGSIVPRLIHQHKCQVCVEIGVLTGTHSLFLLEQCPRIHLYSVSPYIPYPDALVRRHLPDQQSFDQVYRCAKTRLEQFASRSTLIRKTSREASELVPCGVDLVFIDGDHDYSQVLTDLFVWFEKVRQGGVLCGHDFENSADVRAAVKSFSKITEQDLQSEGGYWYFIKTSKTLHGHGALDSETGPFGIVPSNIRFSILMPSIPSRINRFLIPLLDTMQYQIGERKDVEVLVLSDNKRRSVGLKRDALIRIARGEFLAFVDDDDWVAPDYVSSILDCIECNPNADVIVFRQESVLNEGNPFVVDFGVEYENEPARTVDGRWVDIKRKPFHVCAWRTSLARRHRFPDASYGEDWHWCKRVLPEVQRQVRIEKILHYYRYDDRVTEAEHIYPKNHSS